MLIQLNGLPCNICITMYQSNVLFMLYALCAVSYLITPCEPMCYIIDMDGQPAPAYVCHLYEPLCR
jgi:hypothetical protein